MASASAQGLVEAKLAAVGREFGHGFALSLDRIEACLSALGRPQDRLPPILHVAGTNGKGSTCAFLAAIAAAAGLRAHRFTSPHLVRPNERIQLAGEIVADAPLLEALDRVGATGVTVTYFEAVTAAAFVLFAETPADVLVLEVGLGGRLDATNVVRPAVSLITPIDFDHMAFLGPTLAAIAGEKAGVLKPHTPAVVARQAEEAMAVIEARAAAVGAPLIRAGVAFDAWEERGGLVVQTADRLLDLPAPGLVGPHQIDNAGLAVAATLAWGDPRVTDGAIARGVAEAVWPARMQRLSTGPLARAAGEAELWLDGGHNPHAGRALARTLAWLDQRGRPRRTALVVAMLAAKDAAGFLSPLAPQACALIAPPPPAGHAGLAPEALVAIAGDLGLAAETAPSLEGAVARAASAADRVLICGSLYLAGQVLGASSA